MIACVFFFGGWGVAFEIKVCLDPISKGNTSSTPLRFRSKVLYEFLVEW